MTKLLSLCALALALIGSALAACTQYPIGCTWSVSGGFMESRHAHAPTHAARQQCEQLAQRMQANIDILYGVSRSNGFVRGSDANDNYWQAHSCDIGNSGYPYGPGMWAYVLRDLDEMARRRGV